jgi:uncharacterized protein YpmB
MYSIFNFWQSLVKNKAKFAKIKTLDEFSFPADMLSCKNRGVFPDLAIKINTGDLRFTGGELIELKDSQSYTVASFNSTIPTGRKKIRDVIPSENSTIFRQMQAAGDDVYSLEEREVYYLVRGRNRQGSQKICLVHGSFFETVKASDLIRDSFAQVLDEELSDSDISEEVKDKLKSIFSHQESFSRVRNVEKASVRLRFRIMTEVKQEGNILNASQYPEIEDDTLNLIVPYHSEEEKTAIHENMQLVFDESKLKKIKSFSIKHPLNGYFVVYQVGL